MVNFKIFAKSFSINGAYYKKSFTLTREAKAWQDDVLIKLQNPTIQEQFQILKQQFDPTKHALQVCYTFIIPRDKFLTKDGTVSLHTMDIDNSLKLLQDVIFDTKHDSRNVRGIVCNNLDINDKFICQLAASKIPGGEYSIKIEVHIIPLTDL